MRKDRIARGAGAIVAAAAGLSVVACGGGASNAASRSQDTGVTATLPDVPSPQADLPTPSTSETGTDTGSLQVVVRGDDPHGPACSSLTIAQVESVTGRRVVGINGTSQHLASLHRYTCTWYLAQTSECDCGRVSVTATFHPGGVQISDLTRSINSSIADGRMTSVSGVGEHAALLQGGVSSSIEAVQGWIDAQFTVRLAYANVPQNADAVTALAGVAMPLLRMQS